MNKKLLLSVTLLICSNLSAVGEDRSIIVPSPTFPEECRSPRALSLAEEVRDTLEEENPNLINTVTLYHRLTIELTGNHKRRILEQQSDHQDKVYQTALLELEYEAIRNHMLGLEYYIARHMDRQIQIHFTHPICQRHRVELIQALKSWLPMLGKQMQWMGQEQDRRALIRRDQKKYSRSLRLLITLAK